MAKEEEGTAEGPPSESDPPAVDDEQELKDLQTYIEECRQRISSKNEMRRSNQSRTIPPEEYFFKLDSSLKKNTTFVKKLRQFTATQLEGLLKDLSGLNLTKYVSEISQALVEAKIKMTDVMPAVVLCNSFYAIYAEFSQTFLENWQKTLKPSEGVAINPSKMRVDLRFFAELVIVGVINHRSGLALLGSTLSTLINQDKEDFSNLNIILSFCKHCGDEFAGLVSSRMAELAKKHGQQIPGSNFLAPDKQLNLRNLLKDYYAGLVRFVKRQHKELIDAERSNVMQMASRGELSDQKRDKLEFLRAAFDKLQTSTQILSDLLGEPMPDLPKSVDMNEGRIILEFGDGVTDQELDPWGDEETKSFYVDLPDLRLFLPNYAPKLQDITPAEATMSEEVLDMDIAPEQLQLDESEIIIMADEEKAASTPEPTTTANATVAAADSAATITTATASTTTEESVSSDAKSSINYNSKQYYDTFVKNLSKCVNRELIDSACIEFLLHMNTKNNRKKISRSVFGVQRTRLDLLPYFSRFVATLNLVSTDVANELIKMLNNEFRYHVREKDQIKIESKIKVVRFIGELVKFGLYAKIEALFCLKVLLHDFHHHHIEMVCAMLEVCGIYLYNCRESRHRMNAYLEQMMRLKQASTFDPRHTALIESAFYLVKPPESTKVEHKLRTPLQRYVRHLIFEELNKSNVDKVIRQMRTLNWDDKATADYAVRCLTKAYNLRYHLIRCLADLVLGLSSYQDRHMARVIDAVFEDIRVGLEVAPGIESVQLNQRRVVMTKYLGELYNYRLIEKTHVLNTLYLMISLGVMGQDHSVASVLDPPNSLFRLKLVCVLLDTCGEYFASPASRKRLDYFLVFFQRYYWHKKSHPVFMDEADKDLFPILSEHAFKDCLKKLRPHLKLFQSYEEACEAVGKLQQELYPHLFEDQNGSAGAGGGLTTISEHTQQRVAEDMDSDQEETAMSEHDETSEAHGDSEDDDDDEEDEEAKGHTNEDDDEEDDLDADEDEEDDDDDERSSRHESELEAPAEYVPKERQQTQEDLAFESAFEQMTIDCYQERIRDNVKPANKDIPVPIMAKSTKKQYENLQQQSKEVASAPPTVAFVLMTRGPKSGKQQLKSFAAPADSALVTNLKMHEQKLREENESVKR